MSCMKRDASPGSMHDAGCLGLVHWDDPEGWYGEGGGFRMDFLLKIKKKKEMMESVFSVSSTSYYVALDIALIS